MISAAMTPANAMLAAGTAGGSAEAFAGPALGTKDPLTAAKEMSGLFYSQILSAMEKSVPKNDYFGGNGEETFRSLWVTAASRDMASRPDDPLTAMVLKSIQKSQATKAYNGGNKA